MLWETISAPRSYSSFILVPHGDESGGAEDERVPVMRVALTRICRQQFSANVSLAQTDDIADVAAPVCLNHSQSLV